MPKLLHFPKVRVSKHIIWLLIILSVVLALRIPSWFEPYWYGDEGIYLALGRAMERGAVLYRDIWDNKPPLLYLIYSLAPTLLWAKISATACVLGTVYFTYKISKNYLAAFLTGVLLSLPLLEGTIANAELYFTLPVVLGAYLILPILAPNKPKLKTLLAIGACLTAALLLKIPATFDFIGMFLAYEIVRFFEEKRLNIKGLVKFYFPIALIPIISLVFLVGYFYLSHALGDFLTASFSQNASYVAVGSGPFSKFTNPLFVKAIVLLFAILDVAYLYYRKKISRELLFLVLWFGFSLYGALLSNRPYLHYLLQIVPVGVILFFYLISNLKRYFYLIPFYFLFIFYLVRIFAGGFALDTRSYYVNWFDYLSERKTWKEYINYFDGRTSNNYAIANYLATRAQPSDTTFVWGDNAFVYVLSDIQPATKFIQAHHLSTIDQENYIQVMQKLEKKPPKFIIVSRPVHFAFPKLEEFIKKDYTPADNFLDLYVYQLAK